MPYYHPLNQYLLGTTNSSQGQTLINLKVLRLPTTQKGQTPLKRLSTQIPLIHPLNQWLLFATNSNQGPTMMNL